MCNFQYITMKNLYLLLFLSISVAAYAQNTVGLLSYNAAQTYQAYTLIYPHNQANVFLINNCGEIIHTWEDDENFRPGNTAYILPNGNLVKAKRDAVVTDDAIWAGGGGEIVEIRSWDNDLLWSFEMNDSLHRLHHDIEPMPNGNILMVVWEWISLEDAIQAGRDSTTLVEGELWAEKIIEVNPTTDEIVWEWRVMDHVIQDFDASKDNFGVVSEHRELIDLNWDNNEGKADWLHVNSIDYNEELDQIMISVPYFDEIWVIDHTTTTEEAASHSGGFTNHGGDIIYRVGNQAAYQKGDSTDQILFFQHDAHWTNEFLPSSHPDFGKIVVFNNRVGADFSTVEIFESTWDMYISDYTHFQGTYPPYEFTQTIQHPIPSAIHSTGLSSGQLLPNGNILICAGRYGYLAELNMNQEVVWEYKTPLRGGQTASQGDSLTLNNNLTFRAFKYPIDYEAFDGKDLSAKGFIELNPNEDFCDQLVSTNEPTLMQTNIYPNPATDLIHFSWDSGTLIQLEVYDNLGRLRLTDTGNGGMHFLDVSGLEAGLYFLRYDGGSVRKVMIK